MVIFPWNVKITAEENGSYTLILFKITRADIIIKLEYVSLYF